MIVSRHARQRMIQRDITLSDVQYAVACSQPARYQPYRMYTVGHQELARIDSRLHRRLAGLRVIMADGNIIVTVYRIASLARCVPNEAETSCNHAQTCTDSIDNSPIYN